MSLSNSSSSADERALVAGGEFLTFTLGAEEYAAEILKVREIRGYDAVTRIPETPDFVKGVINLRGTIVPIVDLRTRFGLARAEYGTSTVMIVVSVAARTVGLVVDGVSDVIRLADDDIQPVPAMTVALGSDKLLGMGAVNGRMLILLDIDKLVTGAEINPLNQNPH
jgi:purine-binding chemotaxis protein CheW